jgi:hypothetical protein
LLCVQLFPQHQMFGISIFHSRSGNRIKSQGAIAGGQGITWNIVCTHSCRVSWPHRARCIIMDNLPLSSLSLLQYFTRLGITEILQ